MNTLYPGRTPEYVGPTSGLFGWVHHNRLFEWSYDIRERVIYILENKSEHERTIRLYCLVYLDPTDQPWENGYRLLVAGDRSWTEKERTGARVSLSDESVRLWDEGSRLIAVNREAIQSRLLELAPGAPWNGQRLVFPGPEGR